MTTVAYRDGVIASDSQVSSGDTIVGFTPKCGIINGVLYGFSGAMALGQAFEAWLRRGMNGDPPAMEKSGLAAKGLVVHDGIILSWESGGWDRLHAPYYAIGSGRDHALAAMAVGACAVKAVEAACKHDVWSGGPIYRFQILAAAVP